MKGWGVRKRGGESVSHGRRQAREEEGDKQAFEAARLGSGPCLKKDNTPLRGAQAGCSLPTPDDHRSTLAQKGKSVNSEIPGTSPKKKERAERGQFAAVVFLWRSRVPSPCCSTRLIFLVSKKASYQLGKLFAGRLFSHDAFFSDRRGDSLVITMVETSRLQIMDRKRAT